jgi:hypothetical protein
MCLQLFDMPRGQETHPGQCVHRQGNHVTKAIICHALQTDFFLLFLLPPIIFDAGFNLDVKPCASSLSTLYAFNVFSHVSSADV